MNIIPGTIEEPGLDRSKVGDLEAPSGGAVNMHTIKGQVAVITGAAGGIGQALALDMAREMNSEAGPRFSGVILAFDVRNRTRLDWSPFLFSETKP